MYPTLWNQCTLPLKSKLQGHDKYAKVESHKNTIELWKLIEEICSSTLSINSLVQRALKADLSIGNIYGENMELAKYYEVFVAQAKVALEAGVDFSSEALVYLKYREDCEKDISLPPQPVWRDPLVKIEMGLKDADYMKIIKYDAECRLWQLKRQNAVHDERLAHLFLEKAGIKYQEFSNGLEND